MLRVAEVGHRCQEPPRDAAAPRARESFSGDKTEFSAASVKGKEEKRDLGAAIQTALPALDASRAATGRGGTLRPQRVNENFSQDHRGGLGVDYQAFKKPEAKALGTVIFGVRGS